MLIPEPVRRDCRIRILPGSAEAVANGLLHPTIWIGEHHVNDERSTGVLLHELMHLHRRHPFFAVALTFVRCLLWWQPFVWLWVWLARRELEYDCDEACAELLGHDPYRRILASLIRDATPTTGPCHDGTAFVQSRPGPEFGEGKEVTIPSPFDHGRRALSGAVARPRLFGPTGGWRWNDPRPASGMDRERLRRRRRTLPF